VASLVEWVDHPPTDRLTAVSKSKPVDRAQPMFDPPDADRLAELTRRLVSDHLGASPLLPPTDRAEAP
jgi:hypothetical protein